MPIQVFGNNKIGISELGGVAKKMINKTGAASVKGTVVEADGAVDDAFEISGANGNHSIGVVYDDGIADGSREKKKEHGAEQDEVRENWKFQKKG